LRLASDVDLAAFGALDVEIFGGSLVLTRAWLEPMFGPPAWSHWLAEAGGRAIGIVTGCFTDLDAGPCGIITGVGVAQDMRGRGLGSLLTSAACEALFARGATLIHLNPDTDAAARIYRRLGFREVAGLNIYRMR
jgi:ribosomal protein S18 acetylase RimI-like enzyme